MNRQHNPLSWYLVLSPTYTYTDTIDYWIGGPSYEERDVLLVAAYSKTEAKSIAVRHWLKDRKSNAYASRQFGENPYKGVSVEPGYPPSKDELSNEDFCLPYERLAA